MQEDQGIETRIASRLFSDALAPVGAIGATALALRLDAVKTSLMLKGPHPATAVIGGVISQSRETSSLLAAQL